MAETRRTQQALTPEMADLDLDPEHELPPASAPANHRLNETAEAIGGALGNAARRVQNVRDRFTVIRGGAEASGEQIKQTAQQKVEEIKQRAGSF